MSNELRMHSALRLHEYDPKVNRGRVQSMLLTLAVGLLLLLLAYFVTLLHITDPPEGQVELFAIGIGDYGNMTEGSGNRNSFQDPSPTDDPTAPSGARKPEGDPDARDRNVPIALKNRVVTGQDPSEAVQATQPPKFPAKPSPQPKETPKPAPVSTGTPGATNTQTTAPSNTTTPGGGANDGSGTDVGDFGGMDVPQDGSVEFGDGKFGLGGRRLVGYRKPAYRPNRDERVEFLVEVRPDGTVADVTGFGTAILVEDGTNAIRLWKFNAVKTTLNQKVKVFLTFKQK